MNTYHYFPGSLPVIISIPHAGTFLPEAILSRLNPEARALADTDWHLERLYAFAKNLGVHLLIATHSRYLIDLNRSPDGQSLYPGKFTTGLCPLSQFDGSAVYQADKAPDRHEIEERTQLYWQPYHEKLQRLIDTLSSAHENIILFDAHSIRSELPKLFTGRLPDLNLGTADGESMRVEFAEKIAAYCKGSPYSMVLNGRFKGGYITRHYGNPAKGIHAIQLELAQKNYMEEDHPFTYSLEKADKLQSLLNGLLNKLIAFV